MARVNVIYHHFPHYRAPVMRALVQQGENDYRFWGDVNDYSGIKAYKGDEVVKINPIKFDFDQSTGHMALRDYMPAVADRDADAVIIIGNPNIRATWLMALAARVRGKKCFFWAHGWLRPEPFPKNLLRNLYFRLSNGVMVYGERARELAQRSGFPPDKVYVIYNSLDFETSLAAHNKATAITREAAREEFDLPLDARVLVCIARIIPECRLDLLIEATHQLSKDGQRYVVLLVGDGPERPSLEDMAKRMGIDARFTGAIYDEETVARIYRASDVTVSPGKVGLTAIQSLTNGVPVITHGDFDNQMPEVEAVEPGQSGAFFERDSAASLAEAIDGWFAQDRDADQVRADCQRAILEKFNPQAQVTLIDAAVNKVFGGKDGRRANI
ncbi:MAG: glycosyltransferase [Pseudomonadota bacterium]